MFVGEEAAVHYRASPLPVLHSTEVSAKGHFYGLVDADLPGFVIQRSGPTLEAALSRLSLPNEIEVDESFIHNFSAEEVDPAQDLPVHFDPRPNYKQTLLVFHHTSAGSVDVRLFRPGVRLWRSMHEQEGLPADTQELFLKGRVRPDVLDPRAYQAQLHAGSLLVFKAGGAAPFVHHFRTAKAPRASQATWGIMTPS